MREINIRPRQDCKTCAGLGTIPGDLVPMPFGAGSTQMPPELCYCVIEQMPEEGDSDFTVILDCVAEEARAKPANMKLIIEIIEKRRPHGDGRETTSYETHTRVVAENEGDQPHDDTRLPWLAVLFVKAIHREIAQAIATLQDGVTLADEIYVSPPGVKPPMTDADRAAAEYQAGEVADFPDSLPNPFGLD